MFARVSDRTPPGEHPVMGIFVIHSEMLKTALAVESLLIYKWSSKFGNRRRWFRCRPNGVIIDAGKPLDVVYWREVKNSGTVYVPGVQSVAAEYFHLFKDRPKKEMEFRTYESIVADGIDRLPVMEYRQEKYAQMAGQPFV